MHLFVGFYTPLIDRYEAEQCVCGDDDAAHPHKMLRLIQQQEQRQTAH